MAAVGHMFSLPCDLHLALLPLPPRRAPDLVVAPTGNAKPLAGTLTTVTPGQLSLLVTTKVTLLVHTPGAALSVVALRQLIDSADESVTGVVMVKLDVLLLASDTLRVTGGARRGPRARPVHRWPPSGICSPSPATCIWLCSLSLHAALRISSSRPPGTQSRWRARSPPPPQDSCRCWSPRRSRCWCTRRAPR